MYKRRISILDLKHNFLRIIDLLLYIYWLTFDETLNENDEATMSFRYDIIEKEPSTDQYDTPEFHEYAGNILVTLIIQALNNYEEKKK